MPPSTKPNAPASPILELLSIVTFVLGAICLGASALAGVVWLLAHVPMVLLALTGVMLWVTSYMLHYRQDR